jgi:hypothetical protein
MTERRRIPAELTETAITGIDRFCAHHRITRTALIEAIGLELAEGHDVISATVIDRAATIDRHRKSRR